MSDATFYDFDDDRDYDYDHDKKKRSCKPCYPKHPKPKKIFLECGCCPSDAIFNPCYDEGKTKVLDRVTVDTTCLCRPLVKIEFSSLVDFEVLRYWCWLQSTFELELTFELYRICNGNEQFLRDWVYRKRISFKEYPWGRGSGEESEPVQVPVQVPEQIPELESEQNQERCIRSVNIIYDWIEKAPFTITYCDRDCPDCCSYEMRVTATKLNNGSPSPDFKTVNVTQPNISALAQGICY